MGFLVTLLYVSLALLSPGDLLPDLAPYRIMLWLAALAAFVSLVPALHRPAPVVNWQNLALLGFVGAIAFSRIAQAWYGGALLAVQDFLSSAICFVLISLHVDTLRKLRLLALCLVAVALLQAALGVEAYYREEFPHPRVLNQRLTADASQAGAAQEERYELPRVRSLGFLADPNDFAQYLLATLPLLGVFWKPGAIYFVRPLFIALVSAFFLLTIYLTASRGAVVGLAVLILVPVLRRRGRLFALLLTAAGFLLMVALEFGGGRGFSISSGIDRLNIWSEGLGVFKSSPLWGVGYGAFTNYVPNTAHNSFLLCATELGILGLVFWSALLVFAGLQLHAVAQAARTEPAMAEHARLAGLLELCFYAVLATSWFLSRTYALTLYLVLGMAAALYWRAREDWPTPAAFPHPLNIPLTRWLGLALALSAGAIFLTFAAVRSRGL